MQSGIKSVSNLRGNFLLPLRIAALVTSTKHGPLRATGLIDCFKAGMSRICTSKDWPDIQVSRTESLDHQPYMFWSMLDGAISKLEMDSF